MEGKKIKINRAPVLTLWGAVVAERLGFDREEALTLGKAVAGLNAQSKGQKLGIFRPAEDGEESSQQARRQTQGETFLVEVVGRPVPATNTDQGVRATLKGDPVDPRSVERYLEKKFGSDLEAARSAFEALARSLPPEELERRAYDLYAKFRPQIPEGARGWGAAGDLDLDLVKKLGSE